MHAVCRPVSEGRDVTLVDIYLSNVSAGQLSMDESVEPWIGPLDIALALALVIVVIWYVWRKAQQKQEEKLDLPPIRVPGMG